MAKRIELTWTSTYVKWGKAEAMRELYQNCVDARQRGLKSEITHHPSALGGLLRFRTIGKSLDISTLLLGETDKRGEDGQIGMWGEGYKLGCVAAIKSGCTVTTRTCDEKWSWAVERSKVFGAEVPVIYISSMRSVVNEIIFDIDGITLDEWREYQRNLLEYNKPKNQLSTGRGALLLGDEFAGKVFVGGIFVMDTNMAGLKFGFNFHPGDMPLDRDRRMTERWKLEAEMAQMMLRAVEIAPDLAEEVYDLLKINPGIARYYIGEYYIPSDKARAMAQVLTEQIKAEHGQNFVAVTTPDEAEEAKALGLQAVILPAPIVKMVLHAGGTDLSRIRTSPASMILGNAEMTESFEDTQRSQRFARICRMLENAKMPTGMVRLVRFRDPKVTCRVFDAQVCAAPQLFDDFTVALDEIVTAMPAALAQANIEFDGKPSLWSRIVASMAGFTDHPIIVQATGAASGFLDGEAVEDVTTMAEAPLPPEFVGALEIE